MGAAANERKFWDGVFRETVGTPSSSRIFTAVLVVASLVWVSYLVFVKGDLPDGTKLIALTGLVSSLYAANRVAAAVSSLKQ
jgi:hypothetical protein